MVYPIVPSINTNSRRWRGTVTNALNWCISHATGPAETGLCWDDLRFPVQGIALGGQTQPPEQANDGTLLFDSVDTVETIAGVAQMPHSWAEGTTLRPHVHWSKVAAGAGDVVWQFRYKLANVGDELTAWSSWILGTDAVGPDSTADKQFLQSFGDVDMTGYSISCCMLWQVGRDPTVGGDTYTADDAKLWEFDIHYQANSRGSAQQFIKTPA